MPPGELIAQLANGRGGALKYEGFVMASSVRGRQVNLGRMMVMLERM